MKYYTEASLSDSFMFKQLNKSSSLTAKAAKALKTGVVLDRSYIEEQYLQISQTRISPIADKVLKAFNDGKIRLIYNKKVHMTVAVPFLIVTLGGVPTACIFISDYSGVSKDGASLTIEMKKLYCLMEGAYVGLCYFTRPTDFMRNSTFVKLNAEIYSSMVLRILNREYALSLDKDVFDTVNYTASRFFLEHVMGITNKELSNAYAISTCKSPSNTCMEIARDLYEQNQINDVETFINYIAKSNTKMNNLTFRYFFERWVSSFGTAACLSIDSYPYVYFVIINVLVGGFLVNVAGLSEIVKNAKGINGMYAEIDRIVP